MKAVYISGPYSAATNAGRQVNIHRAWEAAMRVWRMEGAYAVCPHCNTAHMDGEGDYEKFLQADLDMVQRLADAMLMLPGWRDSRGAIRERASALAKGIPVFDMDTGAAMFDLEAWLIRQRATGGTDA